MSTPQDPFAPPEPSRPDLTKRPQQQPPGYALPGSVEQETPAAWPPHGGPAPAYGQPPGYGQPPAGYGQPPAYGQ
ncbi:MAG: hypothetical protein JWL64_2378, partial [Frankiales bacterium]|nr:hypothetical protein [Frankiales bacterium]